LYSLNPRNKVNGQLIQRLPVTSQPQPAKKNPGTIGAISEMRAIVDLFRKGYEIYRAISGAAHCDLVVDKNGLLLKVEVTTRRVRRGQAQRSTGPYHQRLLQLRDVAAPESIVYIPARNVNSASTGNLFSLFPAPAFAA
jgi:hypothetical protein